MTEHRDPWPAGRLPKERGVFQGYERWATVTDVRAAFLAKYGHEPKHVLCTGGGVLAGPIGVEP